MEFDINGAEYRAKKMTVFEQLKVCRKLLPVLSSIVPDLAALRETAGAVSGDGETAGKIIHTLLPKMADVLAEMSEESVEAILHPCLSVVSRRTVSGGWTPVFRDGELMFDDIGLFTMLGIAGRVVADNLGNFLPEPPTNATTSTQNPSR
jgi:hypothetical protein